MNGKEQADVLMKRFEKYGINPKQKMLLYDAIGLCLDIADKLQNENETLITFVNDCAENFDCDEDAHTHFTTCRKCEAEAILKEMNK